MSASSNVAPFSRAIEPDDWGDAWPPRPGSGVHIQYGVEGYGTIAPAALSAALAEVANRGAPGTRLVQARAAAGWTVACRLPSGWPRGDAAGYEPRFDSPLLKSRLAERGAATCEVVLLPGDADRGGLPGQSTA